MKIKLKWYREENTSDR